MYPFGRFPISEYHHDWATRLRLLDCSLHFGRDSQVTRIDLTLPEPCAGKVSPMTVEMREYKLLKRDEPKTCHATCFHCVDVSGGDPEWFL